MDATTSGNPTLQYHNIPDQPIAAIVATQLPPFQRQQRHCFGDSTPGEFPLSANPSIVLHVLTACNLDPQDLAKLEASSVPYMHWMMIHCPHLMLFSMSYQSNCVMQVCGF